MALTSGLHCKRFLRSREGDLLKFRGRMVSVFQSVGSPNSIIATKGGQKDTQTDNQLLYASRVSSAHPADIGVAQHRALREMLQKRSGKNSLKRVPHFFPAAKNAVSHFTPLFPSGTHSRERRGRGRERETPNPIPPLLCPSLPPYFSSGG